LKIGRCFPLLLGLSLVSVATSAQVGPLVPSPTRLGQFVAHRPDFDRSAYSSVATAANPQLRTLDPELLAVSCERIKRALLRALALRDTYRGKIHLILVPVQPQPQPIFIGSTRYTDGWSYRLEVPVVIEEDKLVRAVIYVLLQEIANRTAVDHAAELPLWMTEGFTQQLLSSSESDWILQPQTAPVKTPRALKPGGMAVVSVQTGTVVEGRRRDPLFEARRRLRANSPLTFGDLSMPTPALLSGQQFALYQSCSQLLLHHLIELPAGRSRLVRMLAMLAHYYNWQTAFLQAFNQEFQTLLDVEKWWAVCLASFIGRDPWQTWRIDISLEKLDAALRLSAQVQSRTNANPTLAEFTLQHAIQELEFARQREFLQGTIAQLQNMRPQLAPELLSLADAYRATLDEYLRRRGQAGYAPERRGQLLPGAKTLARDAVRNLDSLDAKRAELRESLAATLGTSASP
jgi:hypothetical protein